MILANILLGIAVVGLLGAFWDDLVNFLKKAIEKVRKVVSGIVYGCKVFVQKFREGVKEISRHYSKVDEHWQETVVTKTIEESEVPKDILERAKSGREIDITDELEMKLA